jgi:hypothetical protein
MECYKKTVGCEYRLAGGGCPGNFCLKQADNIEWLLTTLVAGMSGSELTRNLSPIEVVPETPKQFLRSAQGVEVPEDAKKEVAGKIVPFAPAETPAMQAQGTQVAVGKAESEPDYGQSHEKFKESQAESNKRESDIAERVAFDPARTLSQKFVDEMNEHARATLEAKPKRGRKKRAK